MRLGDTLPICPAPRVSPFAPAPWPPPASFQELVGLEEKAEDEAAVGGVGFVTVAGRAPDEVAGLGHAFVVADAALQHVGLLDVLVHVVGHDAAGRDLEEAREEAAVGVLKLRLQHLAR